MTEELMRGLMDGAMAAEELFEIDELEHYARGKSEPSIAYEALSVDEIRRRLMMGEHLPMVFGPERPLAATRLAAAVRTLRLSEREHAEYTWKGLHTARYTAYKQGVHYLYDQYQGDPDRS